MKKGYLKRRCDLCARKAKYCGKTLAPMSLRNRCNSGLSERVDAGAVICEACQVHNEIEDQVQDLPVLKRVKRCRCCGGAGKVRRPDMRGKPQIQWKGRGTTPGYPKHLLYQRCDPCRGEGVVAV